MGLRNIALFLVGVYFLQTQADKYTDENRPYEFGFTIDGEQHRHEKKDENGIVMGEFGFITADGVYHVTVYATDENGNFKILSMKNIRVKPYPTSPGAEVKKSKSSPISVPPKDSVPESTNEEKNIKKQVASPAKSCSHCSLPTTTTTTVTPAIAKIPVPSTENYNHNQNSNNFSNKNTISLPNLGGPQKDYNSKTHQSNPQATEVNYPQEKQNNKISENRNLLPNFGGQQKDYDSKIHQSNPQAPELNYPQEEQNDRNSQNGNLLPIQNLGYQEPSFNPLIPQSYPQTNSNTQSYRNQDVVSNNPDQAVNLDKEQNLTPHNRPLSIDQRVSVTDVKQNKPGVSHVTSIDTPPSQHPISINLQEPINDDYPNQGLPQNKQAANAVRNFNQNNVNNNHNNDNSEVQSYPEPQNYSSNIKEPNKLTISSPPTIINRQAIQPHNEGEKSASGNPKGERTPKSFGDFIQQSIGPEELASTGPNLYRPSLPNASDFSEKPVLLAAQIQKVDKNTNIYSKNPGESDGLPEGVTEDDVTNLLYTFNYTVGFHGHHEKGYSNGAKQGYYYVTGRNGVRTRVDYVADEKGFRPKITQELLDIVSDEVPKPETEKDEKYGLKGYEFKWLYFPLDKKSV